MKGYSKEDVRIARLARKLRAGAAVCVFGLVGVLWLQAEVFAVRWMDDPTTPDATAVVSNTNDRTAISPDAENPSAVPVLDGNVTPIY